MNYRAVFEGQLLLLASALAVAAGLGAAAQQREPIATLDLDEVVQKELKESKTPGAAVAVVVDGRIALAKGFGVASVETDMPVTADTLFRSYSQGKMFTALAVASFAAERRLDLHKAVGAYMPGLTPSISELTLHQLLSHTAGLRDQAESFGSHDEFALVAKVRTWKADRIFVPPGTLASYSNPGMSLAGAVLEHVAGKPFADVVNERVLAPLGMARTTYRPTVAMTYALSQGHDTRKDGITVVRPFPNNTEYWPAGFAFTTANDLARFAIAFMNEGVVDGKRVLPASAIATVSRRHVVMPTTNSRADFYGPVHYGYGLVLRDYRGVKIAEHGGAGPGFGARVLMVPAQKFAVITLTNRSGQVLARTADAAVSKFVRLAPPEPPLATIPMTRDEMKGYEAEFGTLRVAMEGDGLFLRYGQDGREPMTKVGPDHFRIPSPNSPSGQVIALIRGADGRTYLHTNSRAYEPGPPPPRPPQ
jgi:CubicO group peptidase (beta-lactamase class C family)